MQASKIAIFSELQEAWRVPKTQKVVLSRWSGEVGFVIALPIYSSLVTTQLEYCIDMYAYIRRM